MKTLFQIVALSLGMALHVDASSPFVSDRGLNHRTWSRVVLTTNQWNEVRTNVRPAFVELGSGMHYVENGELRESKEEITILRDGRGAATNGQIRVLFPADLYSGNFTVTTPDGGFNFQSKPFIVSLFDGTNSIMLGQISNCTGRILPSGNAILYSNAFRSEDITGDILATYRKSGVECELILRTRVADPTEFGLNPATTRLQLLTEFFNTPEPVQLSVEVRNGLSDVTLQFGQARMGPGKAFAVAQTQGEPIGVGIPVVKTWTSLGQEGRRFLVEEIPLPAIQSQLNELPEAHAAMSPRSGERNLRRASAFRPLPPSPPVRAEAKRLERASAEIPGRPGVVLDWTLLTGTVSNLTLRSDTCYFVSSPLNCYGTTTLEGGTVIKLTPGTNNNNSAWVILWDTLNCDTAPYRPAIFTSMDDGSVGEVIGTNVPVRVTWQAIVLSQMTAPVVKHVQARYTTYALNSGLSSAPDFSNIQVVHAGSGIWGYQNTISARNILFNDVTNVFDGQDYTVKGENLTINGCQLFNRDQAGHTDTLKLTNCVIVDVQSWGTATLHTNYTVVTTNAGAIFQTAGAGNQYLAAASPFRNAGTTNITVSLLTELRRTTTYPPLFFTNALVGDFTLFPQAGRDNDSVDLGYHYQPVDWLSRCVISNATLTIGPGTVLAYYTGDGIWLQNQATLLSGGSPNTGIIWFITRWHRNSRPGRTIRLPPFPLQSRSSFTTPARPRIRRLTCDSPR